MYIFRLYDQYTTAVCMKSAAEQWLALRHLFVASLFMCLATVIVIFTSDISKSRSVSGLKDVLFPETTN